MLILRTVFHVTNLLEVRIQAGMYPASHKQMQRTLSMTSHDVLGAGKGLTAAGELGFQRSMGLQPEQDKVSVEV